MTSWKNWVARTIGRLLLSSGGVGIAIYLLWAWVIVPGFKAVVGWVGRNN